MLRYIIDMKNLLLAIVFTALFCSAASPPDGKQKVAAPDAVVEIADFLKCRVSKKHNVFSVNIYDRDEYETYEISEDITTLSISPAETTRPQYYITLADTLGSTRLPTRHVVKNGKLFYWDDPDYGLTEETIRTFLEFNLAEPLDISDLALLLGQEVWGDERTKAAHYYFCKNNLSSYKRVITSIAIGWYNPPKLRCSR